MSGWENLFGDPDELQRRMAEFAEQMQRQQGLAWADNAIGLAVQMTVAAVNRVNVQGNAEQQGQPRRSKAWPRSSSLHSALTPVPHTAGAYHVQPTSRRWCSGASAR